MTTQSSNVVASGDLSGSYRYEIVKNQRGYCVGVGIDTLDGWHAHPTLAEALRSLGIESSPEAQPDDCLAETLPQSESVKAFYAQQRLEQAAPALYEALKALVKEYDKMVWRLSSLDKGECSVTDDDIRASETLQAARAALSQAEGK